MKQNGVMMAGDAKVGPWVLLTCRPPHSPPGEFPDPASRQGGGGGGAGDSGVWTTLGLPRTYGFMVERWETPSSAARSAHGEWSPLLSFILSWAQLVQLRD